MKVNEVIETNEEAEESCVFIQDVVEDDDDEENRNDDEEKKEEMSEDKSKSDDKATKCEDGFRLQKKTRFHCQKREDMPLFKERLLPFQLVWTKALQRSAPMPLQAPNHLYKAAEQWKQRALWLRRLWM